MFPQHADAIYPAIIATAAATWLGLFGRALGRGGIPLARAVPAALLLAAGGLLGGRLYWLVEQGAPIGWRTILATGYRHPGILLGSLVVAPVVHRIFLRPVPLGAVLDWSAPCMAFAWAVGRVGCFIGGCCFGLRSTLPWAVRFPDGSPAAQLHHFRNWLPDDVPGSLPVHPLQLYFVLLAVAAGVFALRLERRKTYDGQVFLAFVAAHELGKFFLESLHEPELGFAPNWVPLMSLGGSVLAGVALLVIAVAAPRRPAVASVRQPA